MNFPLQKITSHGTSYFRPDSNGFFGPNKADRSRIFQQDFHLGRIPWLTLSLIVLLSGVYIFWQGAGQQSLDQLLRSGARHPALLFEAGEWWRLFSANFIHMSTWHLILNLIFLLNLGGPAESIFHRRDYALLLTGSACISSLISVCIESQISCGASGTIFGIWGGCSVFGIRYRDFLPLRYKRYFIGTVIPYALVALYMGFSFPGVDNWAHLGGLCSGIVLALNFKPRILGYDKSQRSVMVMVCLCLACVLAQAATPSYVPLRQKKLIQNPATSILIPRHWNKSYEKHNAQMQSFAYHNALGAGVGFEYKDSISTQGLEQVVKQFISTELENYLTYQNIIGIAIEESDITTPEGLKLKSLSTRTREGQTINRRDYHLGLSNNKRIIISFQAPDWLWATYEPTFQRIVNNLRTGRTIEE